MVEKLKDIYSRYTEAAAKVYSNAKPMDGVWGWGDDPRKDPCHMAFYEAAEEWTAEFLADGPGKEEAFTAVKFLLETPDAWRDSHCFWFLFAAQGFSRELIPLLDRAQCALLLEWYDKTYPKRERLPVQRDVYKALKKGAG